MSSLFDFFSGEPTTPGSRKRKREEQAQSNQRELKSRRTGENEKAPSFFESLLGPIRNFWQNLTTPTDSTTSQDTPSVREDPSAPRNALSQKTNSTQFKMAPRMLTKKSETYPSKTPIVLPKRRSISGAELFEASPFVPAPLAYRVRTDKGRNPSTPYSSNGGRTDQSRGTPIFTSPFRFSYGPPQRGSSLRRPLDNRESTTPSSNWRPSATTASIPARKTYLEQLEHEEQVAKWENMMSSITDKFEQQPQQVVLREQQQKLRSTKSQPTPDDLSFEYTEQKPARWTLPVQDHEYELARKAERRRAEEKMRQVAEQTKEPIRWPRFPPIPTGIHTTKAPYEREQDYGLLALFRTEDDEEWQGELEDETVESEEEEESDVSGGEEVRGRYYGEGRPLTWRGDSWTSGDHDESDLEIADEFYDVDVDVDEIDMEAVKMEIAIKKMINRKLAEHRKSMESYEASAEEKRQRIAQTQKNLRRLAKEYKKEMRRKMEEQRLIEEMERRKLHIFSKEETAIIQKALKGRDSEIVISGFNADLKKSDIRRLQDTEWLNDEVINFYLELLKERNAKLGAAAPKCHIFNTFFYPLLMDSGKYNYPRVRGWTRKVDIFAMDKVVVPVHMGNHWCLAIINFKQKRIEYYDSLGSNNNNCLKTLRKYLADESMDKKKKPFDLSDWEDYQPKDIPLQKNGYDCGVFMCKYADCASAGRPFLFKQMHMQYFRKLMILDILQKRCSPISF